jgi:drug/metabolite transporter (DMT)-like permease
MNKNFILTGFVSTITNLILHAGVFFVFLKDFYATHPAGSIEYLNQLNRPPDQLIIWALLVSSLAFGFFITTIIKWSGAKTFGSGLSYGFIIGLLFWTAINFGLFSAQNIFSLPSVFADLACSAFAMTISSGVSAWMLGKAKTN